MIHSLVATCYKMFTEDPVAKDPLISGHML